MGHTLAAQVQQADMDQVDDTDLPWRQPKVYAYFVFTPPSHINIAGMVGQVAKLAETGAQRAHSQHAVVPTSEHPTAHLMDAVAACVSAGTLA